MGPFGAFDFETDERMRIYRYVERHGAVDPETVAEAVRVDPESFSHHLVILKRDGYLAETDGKLRVELDGGEAEEFASAGVRYVIRPARQEDFSGVLGAMGTLAEAGTDLVAESVAEQLAYEETLVRASAATMRLIFVATVKGDVVGWAHLESPRLSKLAAAVELTVGVLDEYRRHGIGSHLLQRSMSWAAAHDCRKLYTSLPETNERAVAFLQENGWEIEATRENHFAIAGDPVDEVMLAVDLPYPVRNE